jgi:hypothetical protein
MHAEDDASAPPAGALVLVVTRLRRRAPAPQSRAAPTVTKIEARVAPECRKRTL